MGNYTLTILKPDALKTGHITDILYQITTKGGFRIAAMKMITLQTIQAHNFYAIHKDKPFFAPLVEFMTSGPIVACVLEKENAVQDFRAFIGSTNPKEAKKGTIRNKYGTTVQQNCIHGSDSEENARREIHFFFGAAEIYDREGNMIELL